jgi:hypothetical protein
LTGFTDLPDGQITASQITGWLGFFVTGKWFFGRDRQRNFTVENPQKS